MTNSENGAACAYCTLLSPTLIYSSESRPSIYDRLFLFDLELEAHTPSHFCSNIIRLSLCINSGTYFLMLLSRVILK
jgi:hypothetical protein